MNKKSEKSTSNKPHVKDYAYQARQTDDAMAIPEFDLEGDNHQKVLSAQQFRRRQLTARHLALLSITMGLSSAVPLPAVLNSFFNEPSFKRMASKNTSNFFVYEAPKEEVLGAKDANAKAQDNNTHDSSPLLKQNNKYQNKNKKMRAFNLEEQCPPPITAQGFVNPAHISRLSTSSYFSPYFDQFLRNDKAFCTELVYGYFRHSGLLRLIVDQYVQNPEKLPRSSLYALCLGVYELLFIDLTKKKIKSKKRAATHATLFEYVEIIKTEFGDSIGGLVNAVLRKVHAERETLLQKIEESRNLINTPIEANKIPTKKVLRQIHGLAHIPLLFTEEMNHKLLQIMAAESFHIPIPTYRINTTYTGESQNSEQVFSLFGLHDMTCLYLLKEEEEEEQDAITQLVNLYTEYEQPGKEGALDPKEGVISVKTWEKNGLLTRQGAGSQILAKKIAEFIRNTFNLKNYDPNSTDRENFRLWDACCGRGGKSGALLEADIPVYLCTDPNAERIDYTMESFARLGLVDKEIKEQVAKNGCGEKAPYFKVASAQEIALALAKTQEEEDKRTEELEDYHKNKNIESPQEKRSLGEYSSLYDVPEVEIAEVKESPKWLDSLYKFSCILVDAPCSTSGTIGRNPEVKHRVTPNSLERTIRTQKNILSSTWQSLKREGYLIYVTCSCFKRENEGQVADFLKEHDGTLIEQDYIIPYEINDVFHGHDILYYAIIQKHGA